MRFLFDPKIKENGWRYLGQVALATAALFAVVFVEELITGRIGGQAVIVAAIASTAFLLFIMPHSRPSRPRNALGGHAVALGVGVLFALFGDTETGRETVRGTAFYFALFAAGSVGLSMFLMAATNTEHPPAAGTALGRRRLAGNARPAVVRAGGRADAGGDLPGVQEPPHQSVLSAGL